VGIVSSALALRAAFGEGWDGFCIDHAEVLNVTISYYEHISNIASCGVYRFQPVFSGFKSKHMSAYSSHTCTVHVHPSPIPLSPFITTSHSLHAPQQLAARQSDLKMNGELDDA
jgi:hypothetical protein